MAGNPTGMHSPLHLRGEGYQPAKLKLPPPNQPAPSLSGTILRGYGPVPKKAVKAAKSAAHAVEGALGKIGL